MLLCWGGRGNSAAGIGLTGLHPEGCSRLMAAGCVEGLWKKVLRIDGPFRAQGFLSLTALRAEGCSIALRAMKFYDSASQNGKPQNLASLVEMHPYRWLAPPLPPEGEVLAALYNELLKLALKKAECRLPPPGEVPPQAGIGVHFHRRKGGLPVFFRP